MVSVSENKQKPRVFPGATFGKLTVLRLGTKTKKQQYWECRCECGTVKEFRQNQLYNGMAKSCGCSHFKRGGKAVRGSKHQSTYDSWSAMRKRCLLPSHEAFDRYGGAGITICDRWLEPKHGFDNFAEDMGLRPKGKTLDRIDNAKGYSPENCRWATQREQMNNVKHNIRITWQGETKTASEWADDERLARLGITYDTLTQRHKKDWSIEEMMTIPNLGRKSRKFFKSQNNR